MSPWSRIFMASRFDSSFPAEEILPPPPPPHTIDAAAAAASHLSAYWRGRGEWIMEFGAEEDNGVCRVLFVLVF